MKNSLLRKCRKWAGPVLLGWVLFPTFSAAGASVIVPNNYSNAEGGNNNDFPFDIAESTLASQRYQQVYSSGQFAAAPGGGYITQILFRPDTGIHGFAFSSTLGDVEVDLSTTSAGPDGLSTTFNNNTGPDAAIVYFGSLPLSSACTGPASGPKNFDIVINLRTPFFYNPSRGNLLMDVWNYNGGSSTYFDTVNGGGDSISRLYSFLGSSATTGQTDSAGLVTEFTIVTPALHLDLSGTNVLFSWTTNAVGWHLQSAPSLLGQWSDFNTSTQLQGTNMVATAPVTNSCQLFRLRYP